MIYLILFLVIIFLIVKYFEISIDMTPDEQIIIWYTYKGSRQYYLLWEG